MIEEYIMKGRELGIDNTIKFSKHQLTIESSYITYYDIIIKQA